MKRISRFTKEEVDKIFKKARRAIRHPGLDILYNPTVQETGRILVITPRKVGSAPQRNRIRRQLKSIFYEEKLFEKKVDLIIIIKKKGIEITFDQLKKILLEVFKKI